MKAKVMTHFSLEEEELVRKFIFTNPHGQDSFIYPQSLYSGEEHLPFISAYSRSRLPMQEKVLKFLDTEKTELVREILPMIPKLIRIARKSDGTMKVPLTTARFNRKWAVLMHHESIKEQAFFLGYSENMSDLLLHATFGSHPLCSPLAKSSRYIFWETDFPEADGDILSLPNQNKYREYVDSMNKAYVKTTHALTEFVLSHRFTKEFLDYYNTAPVVEKDIESWITQQTIIREGKPPSDKEIQAERAKRLERLEGGKLRNEIERFVLDYSRVYLIAAVKTSVAYSLHARTLAELITSMISMPRKEDRERGYAIWREAKKLAPVILGSEGALGVNEWQAKMHTKLRTWMENRFSNLMHAAKPRRLVRLIDTCKLNMNSDRFFAAQVVFPYVIAPFETVFKALTRDDIRAVLHEAHKYRRHGMGLHPALCHSGILSESTLPWHVARDIMRHRHGDRSRQLLNTRLGYVTPELIEIAGLAPQYKEAMEKATEVYEEARHYSPYVAEKLVPWGFTYRSLQSWNIRQIAYIIGLRSRIRVGHRRYVEFSRQLWNQTLKLYPETAHYIEGDRSEYPAELWKLGYSWWDSVGRERFS